MLRARFEKVDAAVFISHLDLMRVFQRAFQRSGLTLTHTQGFNPRPSVSIAMPLSLGMASQCEFLDFTLEGEIPPCEEIARRLNQALIPGVRVLRVYEDGLKLKHLDYLDSELRFEYDAGVPEGAKAAMESLFSQDEVTVEKTNRNGTTQQNLPPMIRKLEITQHSSTELTLRLLACCQNPTLNPMQLAVAVEKYLPQLKPDFVTCRRMEVYQENMELFR